MLKAVWFVEESKAAERRHGAGVAAEIERTVQRLRSAGFESGVRYLRGASKELLLPSDAEAGEMLFLSDCAEQVRRLRGDGLYAAGYAHAENSGETFSGVPYLLQEPDLVDADSYCKIYEREAGLPWTILRTPRCLVREFTEEDLEGIYSLYDAEARRFLEPPSDDRAHEKAVLRAYIQRIYGLYGFGHWAVLDRTGETGAGAISGTEKTVDPDPAQKTGADAPGGRLIGRIGFAAVTAQQEREALGLGICAPAGIAGKNGQAWSGIDADFGFLLTASCRGKGIAEEVCRALLRYGFESLGFEKVRADARIDNAASIRLLQKLGFERAGTVPGDEYSCGGQRAVFLLTPQNVT